MRKEFFVGVLLLVCLSIAFAYVPCDPPCGSNARCNTEVGACVCDEGYIEYEGSCVCSEGLDTTWKYNSENDECCKEDLCTFSNVYNEEEEEGGFYDKEYDVCCPKGYVFVECFDEVSDFGADSIYCDGNDEILKIHLGEHKKFDEYYLVTHQAYAICKKTCDDICWVDGCKDRPSDACGMPSSSFDTGCNHNSGCSLLNQDWDKWLCYSTITSGPYCYSCDEHEGEYYKCGSETNQLRFVTGKSGGSCDDLDHDLQEVSTLSSYADGHDTGIYNGYTLVSNNLICGSVAWWCDDPLVLYDEGYAIDYSGWIVNQNINPTSKYEKTIMKYKTETEQFGISFENLDVSIRSDYNISRDNYLEVECDAGKSYVPIPLIQPACWDSIISGDYGAYSAGFLKICAETHCDGYKVINGEKGNVITEYSSIIGITEEGNCPYKEENALITVFDTECKAELENMVKNLCFYDERIDNDGKYHPPLFTDLVKDDLGNVVCVCDSTNPTGDCGNLGKGDGYCVDSFSGGFSWDINCENNGWVAKEYIEARPESLFVINPKGEYVGYDSCQRRNSRDSSIGVYCQESENTELLVVQEDDYISVVVEIKNTGTSNINNPLVIFAKEEFNTEGNSFKDYIAGQSSETVYEIVFNKIDASFEKVIKHGQGSEAIDPIIESIWGFLSWNSDNNIKSRTSNVEMVENSGEGDFYTISPGETAKFVLSLPAHLWSKDKIVEVYFYDLNARLSQPGGNLFPRDYLTSVPLRDEFVDYKISVKNPKISLNMDLKTVNEHEACPPGHHETYGECCMDGYSFMQETGYCENGKLPVDKVEYPELNTILASGKISGVSDCEGCLACFASNMERDSFRVMWLEQGENTGGDPSIVDSKMKTIKTWVGAFFLPRAYSIRMNADLSQQYNEMRTSYSFDSGFETMAYLTDSPDQAWRIKEIYREDHIGKPGFIMPSNKSISFIPGPKSLTVRAIESMTNYPDYSYSIVNLTINGEMMSVILDESWGACLGQEVSEGDIVETQVLSPDGEGVNYTIPSIFPDPDMDWPLGVIEAEYLGDQRIPKEIGGVGNPDWTWNTNHFEFKANMGSEMICVSIEPSPISYPAQEGKIIFSTQDSHTKADIDEDGFAQYDEDFDEMNAFLLNSSNDFIQGIKFTKIIRYNVQENPSDVIIHATSTHDLDYAEAIKYCMEEGVLVDEVFEGEVEKIIGEEQEYYRISFSNLLNEHESNCGWRLVIKSNEEQIARLGFNITNDKEYLPKASTVYDIKELSGYDEMYSLSINDLPGKMPIMVNITRSDSRCERAFIAEILDQDPYVRETPYEVIGRDSPTGTCTYLFVSDGGDYRIYKGAFAEAMEYEDGWGRIDLEHLTLFGDMVNVSYRQSCNEKGPCIVAFGQYDVRCDPDTGFEIENCIPEIDMLSGGLFKDNADVSPYYYSFDTIDTPLKKCLVMNYTLQGNVISAQKVSRTACIYKGVPGIFEEIRTFDSKDERLLINSLNRELFSSMEFSGLAITKNQGVQEGTVNSDFQLFRAETDGAGNSVLIVDKLWGGTSYSKNIDYYSSPSMSVDEAFVSNLHVSQIYGGESMRISFPDSVKFAKETGFYNDFYDRMAGDYFSSEFFGENYEESNGSARYFARRWVDSGTSENCKTSGSSKESVFGETCGYQELDLYFGIMRQGIHEIKFKTISERGTGEKPIDVNIYNSAGQLAGDMQYKTCDVVNGKFSCEIDKDERGDGVVADKMGYVVGCVLLDQEQGELTDSAMAYYMPYVYPMEWKVDFNIVVSPRTTRLVPSYIMPSENSFLYSYSGDGVCQQLIGENCVTAPEDCNCQRLLIENQVHTDSVCNNGKCEFVCEEGWGNCDDDWLNGCEIDITTGQNCGGCSSEDPIYSCYEGDNMLSFCELGEKEYECVYRCSNNYLNCDNEWSNGCEAQDININDEPGCSDSSFEECTCDCDEGYGNCNNDLSDGCEVDLTGNVYHCSECGRVCGPNTDCNNGLCECMTGWWDCNGDIGDGGDGCEVNATHLVSCGACENGWANCDNEWSTGCETELGTKSNCAACNDNCGTGTCNKENGEYFCSTQNYCEAGTYFSGGTCFMEDCSGGNPIANCVFGCESTGPGSRCKYGYNILETFCSDGSGCDTCTIQEQTCVSSIPNCSYEIEQCVWIGESGSCSCIDRTCEPDTQTNSDSSCIFECPDNMYYDGTECVCDSGYPCYTSWSIGCEALGTDANCGSCGDSCGTNEHCYLGNCVCDSGYTRCSGTCVNTNTNEDNCGSCGNECEVNEYCSQGSCVCEPDYRCGISCCDPGQICIDSKCVEGLTK